MESVPHVSVEGPGALYSQLGALIPSGRWKGSASLLLGHLGPRK